MRNLVTMVFKKIYILLASFIFFVNVGYGQNFQVSSSIDSTVIYIGQQCNVTFKIQQEAKSKILLPSIGDTIVGGIEVVEHSMDTLKLEDGSLEIKQNFVVTSFDSALYYIPEFPFVDGSDTVFSEAMSLKVLTVPIDTTSEEMPIADIKPIMTPPFDWKRFFIILGSLVLALVLIGLAIWRYIVYRKNHKKVVVVEKQVKVIRTPYDIAIEKLEKIRVDKIWQQGRIKEYYTQITDVLREYVEGRFSIVAFERTSSEIIDLLAFAKNDYAEPLSLLYRIFTTSDMVKFAKMIPDLSTHTDILANAVKFVEDTSDNLHTEKKEAEE